MQLDFEPASSPNIEFAARIVEHGRRPTVVVQGEIDRATAPAFADAVERAVARGSSIRLHLADVTFIDSSGLRILHRAHLVLGQLPEAIVLVDPGPEVLRALRLVGIDDLFAVELTT